MVGIIFILLTHHGPVYLPKRFAPCSCRCAAIPALSSAFPAGGPEAQRPGQDLGCRTAHWVPPVPPPCPGLRRARSRPRIPAHPGHGTARCPRRWDIPARCEPAPALPRKALPAPMVPVLLRAGLRRRRSGAAGGAGRGLPPNPAAHPAPLSEPTPSTSEPHRAPALPAGRLGCSRFKREGTKLSEPHFTCSRQTARPRCTCGVMSSLLPSGIYTAPSCDSLSSTSTTARTYNYELGGGETTPGTPTLL